MLSKQTQDNIFDIIEKGNFIGPIEQTEHNEIEITPKKWKRRMKTVAIILIIGAILIYGLYSLGFITF